MKWFIILLKVALLIAEGLSPVSAVNATAKFYKLDPSDIFKRI